MAEKKETKAAEKQETPAKEEKAGKMVQVTFCEDVFADLGMFQKGQSYEIPESRFAVWEKASICTKAKE